MSATSLVMVKDSRLKSIEIVQSSKSCSSSETAASIRSPNVGTKIAARLKQT